MIEINLARQIQGSSQEIREKNCGNRWLVAVLILGMGLASLSWWWTYLQQQEYNDLLLEKHSLMQSIAQLSSRWSRLEELKKDKQLLSDAIASFERQREAKNQPLVLLNGISQSVGDLEVWLDRVQMVDQVVEVRGQSFKRKDIETYIEALENHQVIVSLPVVEIFDVDSEDGEMIFSFMIRFTLEGGVRT